MIIYIGAVTEEASNVPKSSDEPKFSYHYGSSLFMTVSSFFFSELTGTLAIHLFIQQRKLAPCRESPQRVGGGVDVTLNTLALGGGPTAAGVSSSDAPSGTLNQPLHRASVVLGGVNSESNSNGLGVGGDKFNKRGAAEERRVCCTKRRCSDSYNSIRHLPLSSSEVTLNKEGGGAKEVSSSTWKTFPPLTSTRPVHQKQQEMGGGSTNNNYHTNSMDRSCRGGGGGGEPGGGGGGEGSRRFYNDSFDRDARRGGGGGGGGKEQVALRRELSSPTSLLHCRHGLMNNGLRGRDGSYGAYGRGEDIATNGDWMTGESGDQHEKVMSHWAISTATVACDVRDEPNQQRSMKQLEHGGGYRRDTPV